MNHLIRSLACLAVMVMSLSLGFVSDTFAEDLQVGDAYVRRGPDGQTWTIGNAAMEEVFATPRWAVPADQLQKQTNESPGGIYQRGHVRRSICPRCRVLYRTKCRGRTLGTETQPG